MVSRETFSRRLQKIESDLLFLGNKVDLTINKSIEALKLRDKSQAFEIIKGDDYIDKLSLDLEMEAANILATQQPTGSDLRLIIAILFMNIDLERMADHAVDISEITMNIAEEPLLKPLIDIPRMIETCTEMLNEALKAFTQRDAKLALDLIEKDDLLDELNNQIFRELLTYMLEDQRNIRRANALLMVSQHLERMGDHATNMGERVYYLVTGEQLKTNPHKSRY
ncbi:MAG: Phosphate-specific transport system accessory protein PhoU [candidate division WS2 bacterium]|uniref:Phosphate-specific transport system accessory protein PhoU n=1 Tax=Psychracetigena formicireducens TaxID=2986056 RepID=A0A9E2BIY6_PSYF1|nr:Phosphate-specific transport system accessory protein PhoU [Candidatus Psychracetigena formicireducens]MBT9145882.1 Phosphate-specific transport system accessory protein PhoU [Candidatus Psychracetigena formicireducens]MBT9151430.1 Phosphate-specific transport system accessory protein PhoU [Candidatus Psychracetigena formicireducens]